MRDYSIYLQDILSNIEHAEKFSANLSFDEFVENYQVNYAVVRCLEIMGEACKQIPQTIRNKYFDTEKKLFSDRTEKDLYSQHANTLAILTGTSTGEEAKYIAKKLMTDTSMTEATIFYKYYVYQALTKAGFGNDYLNWLDIWKRNIKES